MSGKPVAGEGKFTAGPWRESWDYKRISSDSDFLIAHACGPQHTFRGIDRIGAGVLQPSPEDMQKVYADAHLIAAAPELYEALRSIEQQCVIADDPDHLTLGLIKHMARAALCKALGQTEGADVSGHRK